MQYAMSKWIDKAKQETGITDDRMKLLIYNTGIAFLEMQEADDRKTLKMLECSTMFWTWYNRQFQMLCAEFFRDYGAILQDMRRSDIERHFVDFVAREKISYYGINSYAFLLTQFAPEDQVFTVYKGETIQVEE